MVMEIKQKSLNAELTEMMNNYVKKEIVPMSSEAEAKLKELRELRNTYNNKAAEVQKEIDHIILSEQNWEQYEGCYIEIKHPDDGIDSEYNYIKVKEVKRLYSDGCRLSGTSFTVIESKVDGQVVDYNVYFHMNDEIHIDKRCDLRIMDEDEFNSILENVKSKMTI